MTPAPRRRSPPTPASECDLVMKGGITSGVVYPSAIRTISERYRLRSIGGASAGAIAAVVAAACEYRRRQGDAAAFGRLETIVQQLSEDGFVERLFQPTPAARPAFEVALACVKSTKGTFGRIVTVAAVALKRAPQLRFSAVMASLVWLAFVISTSWALALKPFAWVDVVALALVAIVSLIGLLALIATAVALALVRFGRDANHAIHENRLGMCSGLRQPGFESQALTEWLHATIQDCAGLPNNEPLTFAMLADAAERQQITLRLITTDLSYARPVDLPLSDDPASSDPAERGFTTGGETIYYFDRTEFDTLFPAPVVDAMVSASAPATLNVAPHGKALYRLPGAQLPVVVAARLSLSFPMLMSTVPLWSQHPDLSYMVEHAMSDGGICSNFPIQFFDSLFPGRPTFGLDLEPYPDAKLENELETAPAVVFGGQIRLPAFSSVEGIVTFVRQLSNAARNWHDNVQSELPGSRDRICQIRLAKSEGGLNLDMPTKVIDRLVARGIEAGEAICADPPAGFDWNCHRFTRYLTLMQALQDGLIPARDSFAAFVGEMSKASVPSPDCPTSAGYDWPAAAALTTAFLNSVPGGEGKAIDFDPIAPTPTSELRIAPSA
jgi:predicted acylesterase/phospholipase RssA